VLLRARLAGVAIFTMLELPIFGHSVIDLPPYLIAPICSEFVGVLCQ
jgi:hypothetical protein